MNYYFYYHKKKFWLKIENKKTKWKIIKLNGILDFYNYLINSYEINEKIIYLFSNVRWFSTFFLNFNVSLIFLNIKKEIIEILNNFAPNQITKYYENAFYCLVSKPNLITSTKLTFLSHISFLRLKERKRHNIWNVF